MRLIVAATGLVAVAAVAMMSQAQAEPAQGSMIRVAPMIQLAQNFQDAPPPRRRPRVRIFQDDERGVYPSYNPGPNAVRDCSASYVQEFRPSGTVITPRLNCYWRRG